ncbi:hypothetical protein KUCAC02_004875, partial [Chaenocephalus aceratus]
SFCPHFPALLSPCPQEGSLPSSPLLFFSQHALNTAVEYRHGLFLSLNCQGKRGSEGWLEKRAGMIRMEQEEFFIDRKESAYQQHGGRLPLQSELPAGSHHSLCHSAAFKQSRTPGIIAGCGRPLLQSAATAAALTCA